MNTNQSLLRRSAASGALALALAAPLHALQVTLGDGDFLETNWTPEVRFDDGFTTVGSTISRVATGGVPDAYRRIDYSMTKSGVGVYGSVYVLNRFVAGTYDPATQGAINSLDYFENQTRTSAGWSPALVAGNALIIQDGKTFVGPGFVFGPNDFSWTSQSQLGLLATDFQELSGMTVLPTSHPNFGIGGAVLQFGYVRSNSYSFSSTIGHAIDNWSVTLDTTPIPEPATTALWAGLGILGLVGWRRRQG